MEKQNWRNSLEAADRSHNEFCRALRRELAKSRAWLRGIRHDEDEEQDKGRPPVGERIQ